MADMVARSRSMPPVQHNPFWSQKARGELELRQVRPVDLPVPLDSEMDGVMPTEVARKGRASSRGPRSSHMMVEPEEESERRRVFRTPASWNSQQGMGDVNPVQGVQTAGEMSMEDSGDWRTRGNEVEE